MRACARARDRHAKTYSEERVCAWEPSPFSARLAQQYPTSRPADTCARRSGGVKRQDAVAALARARACVARAVLGDEGRHGRGDTGANANGKRLLEAHAEPLLQRILPRLRTAAC